MSTKLHPHIKHFIKTIVLSELPKENQGKWEQKFAEHVFSELIEEIEKKSVTTQKELEEVVDVKLNEIKNSYVDFVFKTIQNSAKLIPLDVFVKNQ